MGDTKIQWHPGFVAAMNLEFAENKEDLEFQKEYNLNTKPLEIDLLIIKKRASIQISNEIGKFFRGHNILEYKSPEDHLDIDALYKAMAYASLYKAYGNSLDERKAEDITVTMIREAKPESLFRYLKEHNYKIQSSYQGIYYITGNLLFPTQIVVSRELNLSEHIWIGSLSQKMKKQDMRELFIRVQKLDNKFEKELADSVLQVSIEANKEVMESWKGDGAMYEALYEIMKPEILIREKEREEAGLQRGLQRGLQQGMQQGIQQGIRKGMQQGMQQGIRGAVGMLRSLGHSDSEIKEKMMEAYGLSEKEAENYMQLSL